METLSKAEIRSRYPDQWVLIGNPVLDDEHSLGAIVNKLISGVVLFASPDKRTIAERGNDFRKEFEHYACIYTSELAKNRKFLL